MEQKTDSLKAASNDNSSSTDTDVVTTNRSNEKTKSVHYAHGRRMLASGETTKTMVAIVVTAVVVASLGCLLHHHLQQPQDLPDHGEEEGECLEDVDPTVCSWECCGGKRHSKLFKEISTSPLINLFADEEHILRENSANQIDNDRCCMTDYGVISFKGWMKDQDGEWCHVKLLKINGQRKHQYSMTGDCAASSGGRNLCEQQGRGKCTQKQTTVPLLCLRNTTTNRLAYAKFSVNSTCSCLSNNK